MKLNFTILGPPVPKERARVVSRVEGGKTKARGVTPKRTSTYEGLVKVHALGARMKLDRDKYVAGMASGLPTAAVGWLCEVWPISLARFGLGITIYYRGQGGDCDNYVKSIADACNGVLWVDDRQVDEIRCRKVKVERGKEMAEVEAWVL